MEKISSIGLCVLLITLAALSSGHAFMAGQGKYTTYGMGDQPYAFPPSMAAMAGPYPQPFMPAAPPQRIAKCKAPMATQCPPPVCGPIGCAPPACGPVMMAPTRPPVVWY